MNWKKIHDAIIERANNRCLEGYSETHHIIPKCLGGSDSPDNLVRLTAREHFIIHKILCILHPRNKSLVYASFMMANVKRENRNYHVGSIEYARLRESYQRAVSDNKRGTIPWNKGKAHSKETKDKISSRLKGRNPTFKGKRHSEESKQKLREFQKGNTYRLDTTHSEESKKKMSDAAIGRVSPNKGKTFSEDTKERMSKAAKNRDHRPHSDETKRKMREAWSEKKKNGYVSPAKGIPRDDETKQKISQSKTGVSRKPFSDDHLQKISDSLRGKAKGKIWITNGIENAMIHEKDGIPSGWYKGMTRKTKK